jgi:cell division protein FtsW
MAAGITGWIGLQTIINLGAVTGLLPITGVPLPLLSFGGTALVVMLASIGVLASIARASAQAASRSDAGRADPRRPAASPRGTPARTAPASRPRRKAADGRARR